MAAVKGRVARRGVAHNRRLNAHVHPDAKAKAEAVADALGVAAGAYLEALIQRDSLDERGRPVWWSDPAPRDQGELPLKSA